MTPLERAARALSKMYDMNETGWRNHVPYVRAVLAAIREPSEELDTALVRFAGDMAFTRHDGSTFRVSELFAAAIDTLLEEGRP